MIEKIKKILENHVGKRNAITSAQIADILGIDEDDTHAQTRELIFQAAEIYDLPIAANNNGYYFIDDEDEYVEYMAALNKRIEGINKRKDVITKNFRSGKQ